MRSLPLALLMLGTDLSSSLAAQAPSLDGAAWQVATAGGGYDNMGGDQNSGRATRRYDDR
jgi:hypothetical protein